MTRLTGEPFCTLARTTMATVKDHQGPGPLRKLRPRRVVGHYKKVKPSDAVRALDAQQLVTVRRCIRRSDKLYGYVVGAGRRWALMQYLNENLFLNGYCAFRLRDAVRVTRARPGIERRALELFGEWPPAPPAGELSLDGTRELVASVGLLFPLLGLYDEHTHRDALNIGAVIKITDRRVHLLEVSPNATWDAATTAYRLRALTLIEFGDRYERALWGLAGPPSAV